MNGDYKIRLFTLFKLYEKFSQYERKGARKRNSTQSRKDAKEEIGIKKYCLSNSSIIPSLCLCTFVSVRLKLFFAFFALKRLAPLRLNLRLFFAVFALKILR
jgi:hypothetical protein